jgi:NADH dehydrogenase [ubiquinone] 1 alpha subcomplex assembly factor 7
MAQVHLVEVSPFMRQQQWDKLQCSSAGSSSSHQPQLHMLPLSAVTSVNQQQQQQQQQLPVEKGITHGISGLNSREVFWHSSIDQLPLLPNRPSIYIAHEFLDALPVHQFIRAEGRGWLEVGFWNCALGWGN